MPLASHVLALKLGAAMHDYIIVFLFNCTLFQIRSNPGTMIKCS